MAHNQQKRSLRRDRTPNPNSILLSVEEAAAELRLSPMTVYDLVAHGELAAIRYGRAIRIPREAIILQVREILRTQGGIPGLQA